MKRNIAVEEMRAPKRLAEATKPVAQAERGPKEEELEMRGRAPLVVPMSRPKRDPATAAARKGGIEGRIG